MRCIHLHARDNIAVVTGDVTPGMDLTFEGGHVVACEAVPRYNKIAIAAIAEGEPVYRYGLPIGCTTAAITPGQFVHVHNLHSTYLPTYTRE